MLTDKCCQIGIPWNSGRRPLVGVLESLPPRRVHAVAVVGATLVQDESECFVSTLVGRGDPPCVGSENSSHIVDEFVMPVEVERVVTLQIPLAAGLGSWVEGDEPYR